MDINYENMSVFFTECLTLFNNQFNTPPKDLILPRVAMTIDSKTATETHGWLNQIKPMRKWIGDRTVKNLQSAKLIVSNVKYENTFELTREQFEDDQYGIYKRAIPALADDAMKAQDRTLIDALLQGTTNKWADDIAFFSSASRKYDGTNAIDNYDTTAYDAAGAALTAAILKMRSYKGHGGIPLMVETKFLLHGPALRTKVHQSLATYTALLAADSSTYVGGQIENPNANIVIPIETPWLVDGYTDMDNNTYSNAGTYWYLLGEVSGIRGLVYQNRLAPELQDQRARLDSEYLMVTDKFQWGVRMRGAGFLSMPHLIYASLATS